MRKVLRNELGYSIVLVFFLIIIVSVLSLTLLKMNTHSLTLSKHEREDQSIFYFAEAGLTYEKEEINKLIRTAYKETSDLHKNSKKEDRKEDDFYKNIYKGKIAEAINNRYNSSKKPVIYDTFNSQYDKIPISEINAKIKNDKKGIEPFIIDITSIGYFNEDKSNSRTVSQSIKVDMNLTFFNNVEVGWDENASDLALWAQNDIVLAGRGEIEGSIATSNGNITTNGAVNITGSILKNPAPFPKLDPPCFPSDLMSSLAKLDDSSQVTNNRIRLTKDTIFDEDKLKNGDITLDIGNNIINIYVENLNILGNINIEGRGELNIFVNNSISIIGSINKNGNHNSLNIYHSGNSSVSGEGIIGGSYIVEKNITLSGNANILGNIIVYGDLITMSGNFGTHGKYLIAPNASITLSGFFEFFGTIISKNLVASVDVKINHKGSLVPPPILPEVKPDYSEPKDLFTEDELVEI